MYQGWIIHGVSKIFRVIYSFRNRYGNTVARGMTTRIVATSPLKTSVVQEYLRLSIRQNSRPSADVISQDTSTLPNYLGSINDSNGTYYMGRRYMVSRLHSAASEQGRPIALCAHCCNRRRSSFRSGTLPKIFDNDRLGNKLGKTAMHPLAPSSGIYIR